MFLFLGIFIFISLLIAYNDFLCYKIPNQLLIILIVLYLIRNIVFINFASIIQPSIYAATTLGVGFILFLLKIMGAGDAKLLAVATLWMSNYNLFHFYMYVVLIGGVMALIYFFMRKPIYAWRHKLLDQIKTWPVNHFVHKVLVLPSIHNQSQAAYQHPISELKALPYGVPIFIAALVLILHNSFR